MREATARARVWPSTKGATMWLTVGLCLLLLVHVCLAGIFDEAAIQFSSTNVKTPVDVTISLRATSAIVPTTRIGITMPRFTRYYLDTQETRSNMSYHDVRVSPSYMFAAEFIEGVNFYDMIGNKTIPYSSALLMIKTINNYSISAYTPFKVKIFSENGLGAACGFPSSAVYTASPGYCAPFREFQIFTLKQGEFNVPTNVTSGGVTTLQYLKENVTINNNDIKTFTSYDGIGTGCSQLKLCNGHGVCDYCYETCKCYEGYGDPSDLITKGSALALDCSQRTCPAGKAIGDLPTAPNQAHAMAECSNNGICDRSNGTCTCFPPFTGAACQRMSCPNDCSGHGKCVSMGELARISYHDSSYRSSRQLVYGTGSAQDNIAWDHDTIYGCLCDSSWEVGFGAGQVQLGEYFGPDCSQKRCPSGDDPYTSNDETSCLGKSQLPNSAGEVGKIRNRCHIDCSNRGICDFNTGTCKCFDGSWGVACDKIAGAGRTVLIQSNADGDYTDPVYIELEGN